MWKVAGRRQDRIVLGRIHQAHAGTGGLPEPPNLVDTARVRRRVRGEDHAIAPEQVGIRMRHAGALGTGDRMARHVTRQCLGAEG